MNHPEQTNSSLDQWTYIGTILNSHEVQVLTSLFESENIPCVVQGSRHRQILGILGPYIELRVLVPKDQETEGKELLEVYKTNRADVEKTSDHVENMENILISKFIQKLGIALILSVFLRFGVATLYAGSRSLFILIFLAYGITLWPYFLNMVTVYFEVDPKVLRSILIPSLMGIDLFLSWIILFYQRQKALTRQKKIL